MSEFYRCPHCKEKIFANAEVAFLSECDICGQEFARDWSFGEREFLEVRTAHPSNGPLVSFKTVCRTCREKVDVAIKQAVDGLCSDMKAPV